MASYCFSSAEIRAQLARILASKVFFSAPGSSAFLSYVVESLLEGQEGLLKEYTVAFRGGTLLSDCGKLALINNQIT